MKKTTFTNNIPVRVSPTHYQITSDSTQTIYNMRFDCGRWTCECPSAETPCKHVRKLIQCIHFAKQIFPDPTGIEQTAHSLAVAQKQIEDLLYQIESLQQANAECAEIIQKSTKRKRPVKTPTIVATRDHLNRIVKLRVSGRRVDIDESGNVIHCSCGQSSCPHLEWADAYLEKLRHQEDPQFCWIRAS
jgi:hypothetical protein